jgi:multiple sugar transport system substrate-binding protein
MLLKKPKKIILALITLFCLILTLTGCEGGGNMTPEDYVKKLGAVSLDYWTTWEGREYIKPIIEAYQTIHPNVSIKIRTWRPEEYEDKLLYYFAKDEGPDIFSIHNTWTDKYEEFIEPMPAKVNLPYLEVSGPDWRKERKIVTKETSLLSVPQLRQKFIDQVADDAIINNKIYGLPYYVDTLVMFYNIDLLNAANIAEPAKNWHDFQEHVKKITKFDASGKNIIISGTALGTTDNIENYFDILSLLMMQVGTNMMSGQAVQFNTKPEAWKKSTLPAEDALVFYTSFAGPTKDVYSWNDKKLNSYTEFANGNLAYFFGYSYHLERLKQEVKNLHFSWTTFPVLPNNAPVNYANYWLETVAKKSKNTKYAWDFLNFAVQEQNVKNFLAQARKPAAERSFIEQQKQDPDLAPFASELLTAKSWYHGAQPKKAENAFAEMINNVNLDQADFLEAINLAAEKVRLSLQKPL